MRNEMIAKIPRLGAVAAVSCVLLMAAGVAGFAAADERQAGQQAFGDGETESPGTAQQRPDMDEPSEDGTDEAPNAASPDNTIPEAPPGCTFRDGPLELVV